MVTLNIHNLNIFIEEKPYKKCVSLFKGKKSITYTARLLSYTLTKQSLQEVQEAIAIPKINKTKCILNPLFLRKEEFSLGNKITKKIFGC